MIKINFKTEEEYFKFVRNALIFTHLRAYNGGCHLWKKEDIEYVKNIDKKELKNTDLALWKKSVDVYLSAKDSYGDEMDYWRDIFDNYGSESILSTFGFNKKSDDDGCSYVMEDLDIDLNTLEKNEDYPSSFPVITCLENGSKYDGPNIMHVYPDDFNKDLKKMGDYSWLEENARNFWNNGEGHAY